MAERTSIQAIWAPFVWASLYLAILAGFGLGGVLVAAEAVRAPVGLWWLAAAQAHGHVQLFGWAGLMVLGVGFHFLPRLRGAPLARPDLAKSALVLLVAGLVLRALIQPLLAAIVSAALTRVVLHGVLVCSGMLESTGASLAIWVLACTAQNGPPLRSRAALWPVLPFFFTAFVALWLALGVNLVGLIVTPQSAGALVPDWADQLTIQITFYAFLVPVSVAMSERTFPLFFRTALPNVRLLRVGLAFLLAGLALRIGGELANASVAAGLGELSLATAFALFVLVLGVFAPRRPLPRQVVRPLSDPLQLTVISAYAWLMIAAALLAAGGLAELSGGIFAAARDAQRHVLGAGFVTMLIFGVGAHLLPGFARRRLRSRTLLPWMTLVFGNAAALLRVGPLFLPATASPTWGGIALSLAGPTWLVALAAFGFNVLGTPRRGSSGLTGDAGQ